MSYTILEVITAECPDFATDPNVQYFIDKASCLYSQDCFGDKYNTIVGLRVCHDMSVRDLQNGAGSGSAGNVTSKKEGDQSITFGGLSNYDSNSDTYLQLTRFGQQIISIKRGQIIGLRASGDNETLDGSCFPQCI